MSILYSCIRSAWPFKGKVIFRLLNDVFTNEVIKKKDNDKKTKKEPPQKPPAPPQKPTKPVKRGGDTIPNVEQE